LLEPFEIHEVRKGEQVANFKATVALTAGGTSVLCGDDHFNSDNFPTEKKVQDAELSALLELSMDLKEQKKRAKAA